MLPSQYRFLSIANTVHTNIHRVRRVLRGEESRRSLCPAS